MTKFLKINPYYSGYYQNSAQIAKLKSDVFDIIENSFTHHHMREVLGKISDKIDSNFICVSSNYVIDAVLAEYKTVPEQYVKSEARSRLLTTVVNELEKRDDIIIYEMDKNYGGIEYRLNMTFLKPIQGVFYDIAGK